jgi:hypothetical protein
VDGSAQNTHRVVDRFACSLNGELRETTTYVFTEPETEGNSCANVEQCRGKRTFAISLPSSRVE